MSEINSFSDYTNKYNSNVDYSALFGGTSNSSSLGGTNILSDYASIKNGSYGKLLKAYYAKQDAEKTAGTGDSQPTAQPSASPTGTAQPSPSVSPTQSPQGNE